MNCYKQKRSTKHSLPGVLFNFHYYLTLHKFGCEDSVVGLFVYEKTNNKQGFVHLF